MSLPGGVSDSLYGGKTKPLQSSGDSVNDIVSPTLASAQA